MEMSRLKDENLAIDFLCKTKSKESLIHSRIVEKVDVLVKAKVKPIDSEIKLINEMASNKEKNYKKRELAQKIKKIFEKFKK